MANGELLDVIGSRGEHMFFLAITDYQTLPHPLFRPPAFLGEKWPDVDYLVKLWGARGTFFVQVKTTESGLTTTSIEVRLTQKHRKRIADLPGPTYLVGVHEPSRRCFIRSVNGSTQTGFTSIPLTHELNAANLQVLFQEVKSFWQAGTYKPQQSSFA